MRRRVLTGLLLGSAALAVGGCGSDGVDLPENASAQMERGAVIFQQSCAACHTLNVAGAQGSAFDINEREYKDGPNFNERREEYEDVLYAIRNGGFSSGPMPQNIVTGEEAEAVARFVARYSGGEIEREPVPGEPPPEGAEGQQGDERPAAP